MNKTVLCAIDMSRAEEERPVLETAMRLAQLDDAQLDVITVLPDIGSSVVGAYFQDHDVKTVHEDISSKLHEFVTSVVGKTADDKVRHLVAVGNAYREILNAAEISKADLIVIGAHQPDLRDYLLGPNAARVVRHSTCSVHVVR